MLILGIETSGSLGSVALSLDGTCLIEKQLNQAGQRHAQSLVLEIGEVLREQGRGAKDVELVAVSRGPGSFTGLRVGMACAKTFAYATGCRFIAVDTFAAIARNLPAEVTRVEIIEDAQRDDLFAAEYRRTPENEWVLETPIQIISVVDFLKKQTAAHIITGPGVRKLKSPNCPATIFSQPEICLPKASEIASLGWRMRQGVESLDSSQDFWKALPFYVRPSAAEEKRAAMTDC